MTSRYEVLVEPRLTDSDSSARVFRTLDKIAEVEHFWKAQQETPDVQFNLYRKSCSHRGDANPYIVVIYRGREPSAILIGKVRRKSFSWPIGFWKLSAKANFIEFPRGALLGDSSPASCKVLIATVLRDLCEGLADVARFKGLTAESELYQQATRIPGLLSRDYVPHTMTRWGTTIPSNVEAIYKRFSSHRRSEIRRKIKKLYTDFPGGISVRRFDDSHGLERMIRDVEHVAAVSHQRSIDSRFADSTYMSGLLKEQIEENIVRCFVLYIEERPIAFWVGVLFDSTFYGRYMAHDPEYNYYSPGIFLTMNVIERFCEGREDRVTYVDYGTGDYPYKEWLCDCKHQESFVHLFAPNLSGFLLNSFRTPMVAIDHAARGLASRVNLLHQARKLRRFLSHDSRVLHKNVA